MTNVGLGERIRFFANQHMLDPVLVAALILHESEANPAACRFEEKWFAAKLLILPRSRLAGFVPYPTYPTPSVYDEKIWRAHSWGYMQVLGETARVLGFKGQFLTELLVDRDLNLKLGCFYLKSCLDRVDVSITDIKERYRLALLGYNGGGNPDYPSLIMRRRLSGEAEKLLDA